MFTRAFLVDAAERVLVTYLEAFFALLITDGLELTDLGALKLAAIAAIPAGLAALKAVIASAIGSPTSASLVE